MTRISAWTISVALAAFGCGSRSGSGTTPAGEGGDTIQVKLCDNHTTTEVSAGMDKTRENGQIVADALMAQWRQANPGVDWETDVKRSWDIEPPADNRDVLEGGRSEAQTYGQFTERDVLIWTRESSRAAMAGARVFHDAEQLGSTIAVSCDMCHPDAANTHPETYPKYQTQLGRVALLRDMINWCLEHPVRAPAMEPDDPRMRAMEAYIYAQRKGEKLDYGKH